MLLNWPSLTNVVRATPLIGATTTVAGIDPKYYYLTAGLLGLCTLVGLIVAYNFQRDVNDELVPPTEKDLFGPLEKAYYSGLMDEDEFHRLKTAMARQKTEELPLAPKTKKLSVEATTVEERAKTTEPKPDTDPGEA